MFSHTVIGLVSDKFVEKQVQQVRKEVQHELALVRYAIEANVYRDTFLADSFASFVALNPDFAMKNWSVISEQLLSKARLVRNIGLAPNDIISHVYPLEGNEKAVGLDFRTVPNQYKTVLLAKESKNVYIAGPLELVQGGRAIIARYPIFTDIPHNNEYWGGLSVVINYEKLIEKSNLHTLKGVDIALVASQQDQLIEGDEKVITEYDVIYPIYLPNGNWTLFAKYTDFDEIESIGSFKVLFSALGWMTFSVIYILVLFLINNYLRAHKLSLHDELTKLPNRRYLFNELERIMSRKGASVQFTVLNIDLNKFKAINDSLGHEAGDEVLKHTASLLTRCVRSSDFVSRVGGDEFVVVLQRSAKPEDVEQVIRNIHSFIENNVLRWNDHKIWLSISIGYCSYIGKADPSAINDILSKADKSMYQEKRAYEPAT
ncbi:diguanylate cyclase domain-containing protein [Vibrio hepatarius]|uniref:diguanylate cyclase domain-containing protein n=1 Tax=Vibrio hepatarius TaxID=171383 RepID=UPI001FDF331E|nr:diguanylate cyclase [Vibrio hepatarius]